MPQCTRSLQDQYEALGLTRDATDEQIRMAHRKLSMDWHPDRVSAEQKNQATDKIFLINAARDLLLDAQKRVEYDMYGVCHRC